jgi:hypothetical protein
MFAHYSLYYGPSHPPANGARQEELIEDVLQIMIRNGSPRIFRLENGLLIAPVE